MKRFIIRQLIRLGIMSDVVTLSYDIETVRSYPYKVGCTVYHRHKYFPENDHFEYIIT